MREGFDVAIRCRRALKQGVIEKQQYDEWDKTRKAKNVYAGRRDCRRKQETTAAYALATTDLNNSLGEATLPAMAAAGIRTEEHAAAIYGMSGDTNKETLEIGKAGKGCNIFSFEKVSV